MDTKTHIRLWIGMALVFLLLSPFLRSGPSMIKFASEELDMTVQTLGPTIGGWIVRNVDVLFSAPPVAAAVAVAKRGTMDTKRQRDLVFGDPSKGTPGLGEGVGAMANAANSIFTGFILACYVASVRLLIVVAWFAILSPILVAAVIDGFAQRAIKQYEFAANRPAAFSIASMIVVPFAFGPILYLTAPVSVTPAIVPVLLCVACLPLALLIANTQPVFGKH